MRLARWKADNLLEDFLFSFAIGFALLSYIVMGLGFVGLLRLEVVLPLLIIFFLAGITELRYFVVNLSQRLTHLDFKPGFRSIPLMLLFVLLLIQAGMNLIASFTPPYEWDTLSYHLYCQKQYIASGKIVKLPFIHQSYYTCGVELVYGVCLLLDSDIALKLLHNFFGWLVLLLIYVMCRRWFSQRTALLASAIFYTCPIPVWFAGVGKNDLGTIFFITLALYASLRWWEGITISEGSSSKYRGWFLFAIVLMGISLHIDYRGLIALAIVSLFFTYHLLFVRWQKSLLTSIIIFVAGALLIGSPWYIRNYVYTGGGSPVYPFFTAQLGGTSGHYFEEVIAELNQKYRLSGPALTPDYSIWYYLSLPFWKFTILGRNYDLARFNAKITPLYLILLPLFIFCRKPKIAQQLLAIGLLYIVLTQLTRSNHTRYLVPIFPLLAVAAAFIVNGGCHESWQTVRKLLLGVVLLVCTALVYDNGITFLRHKSLEYVAGIMNREQYVTLRSEIYPAVKFINTKLPRDAKILFISDERLYYCERTAFPLTALRLARFVIAAGNNAMIEWRDLIARLGITHILYNPGFHLGFEQLPKVSLVVDEFLEKYKAEHLKEIYAQYGIEIYEVTMQETH